MRMFREGLFTNPKITINTYQYLHLKYKDINDNHMMYEGQTN